MSALWFIAFSLIWTGLLTGCAFGLCRGPVPAPFAHAIWRGAASLSILPWLITGAYALIPSPIATPIPDLPYIGGAAEALSSYAGIDAATRIPAASFIGQVLLALLGIGWAVRAGFIIMSQWRLQKIKRSAQDCEIKSEPWAHALGLKQAPATARIAQGSPFLSGIRRRTIYLPEVISNQADADIILAHECTHIARGDLLTRPIERSVADVFWFSPFAWMMRRELDYWREAACDAQAAALIGDNVAYARALAKTARITRPQAVQSLPAAAFILPRQEMLKKRLTHLLARDGRQPRRRLALAALAAGLVLAPLSLAQASSVARSSIFTHPVIAGAPAKLIAPFGEIYIEAENKTWWHSGVGIKADLYTHVHAPANAKVIALAKKDELGYTVDILLEDGRKMRFAQLNTILVELDQKTPAGTVIGKVGMSGEGALSPHLHLEVYQDGAHVDPARVKGLILFEGCCAV
ncbi:MAG: M56 family metallopeptidase [Pseudomonadota bacterium]